MPKIYISADVEVSQENFSEQIYFCSTRSLSGVGSDQDGDLGWYPGSWPVVLGRGGAVDIHYGDLRWSMWVAVL